MSRSNGRVPPHNLDAEKSLLGALLLSRDALDAAQETGISAADFYKPAHQDVYEAIARLAAVGDPVDSTTVAEELRRADLLDQVGGRDALLDLQAETPSTASAAKYARLVIRAALLRRLIGATTEIAERLYADDEPADVATFARDRFGSIVATDGDAPSQAWPTLDPTARYGLAGEIVDLLEPATEADPVGLLVDFLTAVGNAIGSGPMVVADGAPHPARLFAVLVGESARARKGTSRTRIENVLRLADDSWARTCTMSAFGSGEAVVAELADPNRRDHRLFIVEGEFARVLAVGERQGSTLSATLRDAWDGRPLRRRTASDRQDVKVHHVSTIGHITVEELRARLTSVEVANGFANRFLWVCVRRSKLLPSGGSDSVEADIYKLSTTTVTETIRKARTVGDVVRTAAAEKLWADLYEEMADDTSTGLVGGLLARAEAQTLRLSLLYALLDGSKVIDVEHLTAAWALWRYCRDSVLYLFGDASGDPLAEKLLGALRRARPSGLTRSEIRRAVGSNNVAAGRIDAALALLRASGYARRETRSTGGRNAEVWLAR